MTIPLSSAIPPTSSYLMAFYGEGTHKAPTSGSYTPNNVERSWKQRTMTQATVDSTPLMPYFRNAIGGLSWARTSHGMSGLVTPASSDKPDKSPSHQSSPCPHPYSPRCIWIQCTSPSPKDFLILSRGDAHSLIIQSSGCSGRKPLKPLEIGSSRTYSVAGGP